MGEPVPGISRSVELFNQTFRLGWSQLTAAETQKPNVSALLSEAIARRLKLGATDTALIAAEAIIEIRRSD